MSVSLAMTHVVALQIAEALRKNRQVTSLDLSGNGIGDEGAQV